MHGHKRQSRAALWLTGAAALLVIGGAAATVGVVRLQRGEPDRTVAEQPVDDAPARRPDQITIDIDPTSGFVATVRGTDTTRQFVTAHDFALGTTEGGRYAGEVSVYDPGTFDAAPLRGGEVVDVAGHDARYVPAYRFAALSETDPPHRSPAVGWQDPSGVWLLVYSAPGEKLAREDLIRLAESITMAPPRDLRTPFRLGATPNGLAVTYVRSDEQDGNRGGTIGLSDPRRKASSAAVYEGAPYGVTVSISAIAPDAKWAAEKATLGGGAKVGGYPAWYSEGKNMLSPEGNGSVLAVETEQCVLRLRTADRKAISRAELNHTVEDMAIGDCSDPDTWITPLR
jgi:hypothetical protein